MDEEICRYLCSSADFAEIESIPVCNNDNICAPGSFLDLFKADFIKYLNDLGDDKDVFVLISSLHTRFHFHTWILKFFRFSSSATLKPLFEAHKGWLAYALRKVPNIHEYLIDMLKVLLVHLMDELSSGLLDISMAPIVTTTSVMSLSWRLSKRYTTQHHDVIIESTESSMLKKYFVNSYYMSFYNMFIESPCSDALIVAAKTLLLAHIKEYSYKNNQDALTQSTLPSLIAWMEGSMLKAIQIIAGETDIYLKCREACMLYLHTEYFKMRCSEMFEILVEYPESRIVIEDMKVCINFLGTESLDELVTCLDKILQKRLLHAAATTSDILIQYVSCVRALRQIDPEGIVAEKATRSLRKYVLKMREDAVRCIVAGFTDESSNLYAELQDDETEKLVDDQAIDPGSSQSLFDDQDDDYMGPWQPVSKEASLSFFQMKQWKSQDTLRAFVQIFGNRDRFVNEYLQLLASRILQTLHYDTQKERQTIEWLKLRCGEYLPSIHQCEVMLKDVSDSKRVDQLIHSSLGVGESCLHPVILSRLFWPSYVFKDSLQELVLPSSMERYLEVYAVTFERMKPERKLEWHRYRGKLRLCIELHDRKLDVVATVIQAAVLFVIYENSHEKLSAAVIASKLNIGPSFVRKALGFWFNEDVLQELSDLTIVVLETMTKRKKPIRVNYEEEAEETVSLSVPATYATVPFSENEISLYWTFINSMLMNLGALPVDRIHGMLAMFIQPPLSFDKTIEQLQTLLKRLIQEDKLEYSAGVYKLKK